ncbi:phosphotransferase family protein [Paenibacillus silvae]|uniref:phosphotransferase family protein n=1 Tax=Paenibacillus silvae TaxID=1325358 RepID=UPI0020062D08|nr:phosphotransferase [Paenibacillus silvae]MCK6075974.1 aminoglycoside phosphotransferase family protein [Paenibacillus silvae]MCK6150363.1 aminoglycoside phosphotransferase family protein [Paenibacillus silvae]MCK6268661.1 aminoglycoside phosphotransferase family protein [Paenibacillus silvae]
MKNSGKTESWVTSEGILDEQQIIGRQKLYQGLNGRHVERFTAQSGQTYIFKPLTNPAQYGRERWMYEHVMPQLPPVYPQLIAASGQEAAPEQSWMIYEDMGQLEHFLCESTLMLAAAHMAEWHTLPITAWQQLPRVGHKPAIRDMLHELERHRSATAELLTKLHVTWSASDLDRLITLLLTAEDELPLVLCHGDLHPGNVAEVEGRLVILDWEHAHLNTPLWDVYHLLDLSHPLFPRTMTPELRARVMKVYLDKLESLGVQVERVSFAKWYDAYAIVFSLWMLRLIDGDLRNPDCIWPQEQLRNQWHETAATLEQCIKHMNGY